MAITLEWASGNTDAASIEVYRFATNDPNYQNTVQPPLATIAGSASKYVDNTATSGSSYFYAIKTILGGTSVWTPLVSAFDTTQRGPGSNVLIYGDERLGYFGTVPAVDLPLALDKIAVNNTATTVLRMPWHKFIRKGKILYVMGWFPPSASFTAASIMTAYGIDNGIDWGVATPTWPTSGKNTILEKNGFKYYPRFPRGCPDTWRPDLPDAFTFANFVMDPTTEFNEIVMPVFAECPYPHPFGSVVIGDPTLPVATYGVACAERGNLPTENMLLHRVGGATGNSTFSGTLPRATNFSSTATSQTAAMICMIYELIEG